VRPIRCYICRYTRALTDADPPTTPTLLEIVGMGRTPCAARGHAFVQLEQRLRREALPRAGWRLISITPLPAQGAHVAV
jgi:hypothetical protein